MSPWSSIRTCSTGIRQELVPTLVHELCHLAAGPRAGHGPKWRAMMAACGAPPTVCHRLDTSHVARRRRIWLWRCKSCGEGYVRHHRGARRYRCADCGGRLQVMCRTGCSNLRRAACRAWRWKGEKAAPESRLSVLRLLGDDYCRTTRTTRRFWARPSRVLLSATGSDSPYEIDSMRKSGMPCFARYSSTASARCLPSFSL